MLGLGSPDLGATSHLFSRLGAKFFLLFLLLHRGSLLLLFGHVEMVLVGLIQWWAFALINLGLTFLTLYSLGQREVLHLWIILPGLINAAI